MCLQHTPCGFAVCASWVTRHRLPPDQLSGRRLGERGDGPAEAGCQGTGSIRVALARASTVIVIEPPSSRSIQPTIGTSA